LQFWPSRESIWRETKLRFRSTQHHQTAKLSPQAEQSFMLEEIWWWFPSDLRRNHFYSALPLSDKTPQMVVVLWIQWAAPKAQKLFNFNSKSLEQMKNMSIGTLSPPCHFPRVNDRICKCFEERKELLPGLSFRFHSYLLKYFMFLVVRKNASPSRGFLRFAAILLRRRRGKSKNKTSTDTFFHFAFFCLV
jgi:hypothetical protein